MSVGHLGSTSRAMTGESADSRNSAPRPGVTDNVGKLRGALPFVRSLFLAAVVTALIMIGLPAVLALGAAVH